MSNTQCKGASKKNTRCLYRVVVGEYCSHHSPEHREKLVTTTFHLTKDMKKHLDTMFNASEYIREAIHEKMERDKSKKPKRNGVRVVRIE